MTDKLQVIETKYNEYRFRSRLEARWAVFFDELGVKYEYEKEGYKLRRGWYLPDFWLPYSGNNEIFLSEKYPNSGEWIEIKGMKITEGEMEKAAELSVRTKHSTNIFSGGPWYVPQYVHTHRRGTIYEYTLKESDNDWLYPHCTMIKFVSELDVSKFRKAMQKAKQARFEYE